MTTKENLDNKQAASKGRKPVAAGELVDVPEMAHKTPEDMAESEVFARKGLGEIDSAYGNDLPYDKGRLEDECKFYLAQSTKAAIEMGKRLILLKEHEPHGEFTKSIERIGLAPRTARQIMQATVKFRDKTAATAVLKIGKLYELMTQDDEKLQALEEGGTLAGLNLDEIDRMTISDLRKALREKDADLAAKDKVLADKDKKLNAQDQAITKITMQHEELTEAWDYKIKEDAQRITDLFIQAKDLVGQIRALHDDIEEQSIYGEGAVQQRGVQVIGSLFWHQASELTSDTAGMMEFANKSFLVDANRGSYDIVEIMKGLERDE